MERDLLKAVKKLASEHPKLRKQLVPFLRKTAAAAAVPVFGQLEKTLRDSDIEKMFRQRYPRVVPGSLRIDKNGFSKVEPGRVYSHVNIRMETTDGGIVGGALILTMMPTLSSIRVVAYVSIDG